MPKAEIKRKCYALSRDGDCAELALYGDIVDAAPVGWDGNLIPGDYIILSDFLADLDALKGCRALHLRINSCGGDAAVAITIHNRLREWAQNGVAISCMVDGVAMSGGSLIMCACDHVEVYPSSLIMIHKCWSYVFGGYNADELREIAASYDAYDKAQVAIYARKTGLDEQIILNMMSEATYLPGREAVEKGFADAMCDGEGIAVAASADRHILYAHGREIRLAPGMLAPDYIPQTQAKAAEMPAEAIKNQEEEGKMAENDKDTALASNADTAQAIAAAVAAERQRLQEIDEVAALFDAELVREARFGEKACTASELSYRAAKRAAEQGHAFLAAMREDAQASGANGVGAAQEPEPAATHPMSRAALMEQGRAAVRAASKNTKKG